MKPWDTQWKDYYDILEVTHSAREAVIQGAYQRLAVEYHPDTGLGEDSTKNMRLLNEARDVLSNTLLREAYDAAVTRRTAEQAQREAGGPDTSGLHSEDRSQDDQREAPRGSTTEHVRPRGESHRQPGRTPRRANPTVAGLRREAALKSIFLAPFRLIGALGRGLYSTAIVIGKVLHGIVVVGVIVLLIGVVVAIVLAALSS